MSVVLEIDLLLEQVRAVVSEQLAGTLVTPASCQVLWWLQAEGPSPASELAQRTVQDAPGSADHSRAAREGGRG